MSRSIHDAIVEAAEAIMHERATRAPSPLTRCAGAIQGASRRILDVERPTINGRLLASGIAWTNTEGRRRYRR